MFEHESVQDLMALAHETPYGKKCSALWAEAARRAGAEGLEREELVCYMQLAVAFTLGGEVTRMVAPFMWVDKRRKERPDLVTESMQRSFGWYFKYLMLVLREIPQVPADECFRTLDQMREYYQGLGDSLKPYYLREYYMYTTLGRVEDAEEAYRKWQLADKSDLSDCAACDPQHEVGYLTQRGRWEEAVEVGNRALASSESYCSAQPENMYSHMLVPWLRTGNDAKAWPAHVRAMQRNSQRAHFLKHFHQHLFYLELSGSAGRPQRLQRGLELVTRFLPWWLEAETPIVLMEIATASARVFAAQPDQQERLDITLPGQSLPWVRVPDLANPTMAEAHEWCAQLALKIAAMFDARPGLEHPHQVAEVTHQLYHLEPAPVFHDTDALADVSGQFSPVNTDYRLQSALGVAPEDAADGTPENPADGDAAAEEQPPIVAIDIHGPWRELTEEQLVAEHAALGTSMPSIFSYRLDFTCDVDIDTAAEREPARQYLLEAHRLLAADNYMEAARAADRAMRTPSEEPISVRLIALRVLAVTALMAGYFAECCEAARHRLNLAAACGLLRVQLDSAILLVHGLLNQEQWSEAAEVAHTALAALQHAIDFPSGAATVRHTPEQLVQQTITLRELLVRALSEADLDTAAAHEALRLAELAQTAEQKVSALDQALNGFHADREYERCFAVGDQLVAAAESMLLEVQAEATVDESAQHKFKNAVKEACRILMNVALVRSEQPAMIDESTADYVENLLRRRLDLLIKHLTDETHGAEYYRADNLEDHGLIALRCRRLQDAMGYLERAADEFLALGYERYAARALNTAAHAQLQAANIPAAKNYVLRSLSLLEGKSWENARTAQDARELYQRIQHLEAEGEAYE
ncbi:hypothetical protein FRX94_03820 [Corynebacterium canis]|uniref:Tetratricopeptide repeat protein n=1 Tax=Corynebacterium canis TaxID=679663 RepID=A0A5C5ULT1_9CORY|nr:hypothetical protein [Corynebacterium canis]TWT26978.1 hypothetical protein FRX94_03820 [Corynebacterium canis]WJY75609.1 hypothetical protein CCANI_08905 [Corynebacterium canis]